MLISEAIAKLEAAKEKHGDLPLKVFVEETPGDIEARDAVALCNDLDDLERVVAVVFVERELAESFS